MPPFRWDKESGSYFPTDFGKATLSSGLPPDEALLVKQDLARARMGFCMATDLHLTYLITPVREELPVDWHRFYDMFERLAGAELKVAGFVGVAPYHIVQQKMGAIRRGAKLTPQQQEQARVATRYGWAALVIFHDGHSEDTSCFWMDSPGEYGCANLLL
jgi:DNA polymerase theta